MAQHLECLEKILTFVINETYPEGVIDILYEDIKNMVERHLALRDMGNYVAYFRLLLSSPQIPKKLEFRPELTKAFIDRTYAEDSDTAKKFRIDNLHKLLEDVLEKGTEINVDNLMLLENKYNQEMRPSFERLRERVRVALILKWLRGPLSEELSEGLQHCITFLATTYGQYQIDRVSNIDWQPYVLSKEELGLIAKEYKIFEITLIGAMQAMRNAKKEIPPIDKHREQFRVIFKSLDNLIKLSKGGEKDSIKLFKDKIIVTTALIYMQDDFVEKDTELKKLTQLFVSLYYQFRDKHYATYSK